MKVKAVTTFFCRQGDEANMRELVSPTFRIALLSQDMVRGRGRGRGLGKGRGAPVLCFLSDPSDQDRSCEMDSDL